MTDFAHALAVKKAVQARLLAIPGVHAVGVGPKMVNGQRTGEPAIIVFLVKKKAPGQLPPGELIPPEIDGVKTDVVEEDVPQLQVDADETWYRPVGGGIQIIAGGGLGGTGTLGCIARTKDPPERIVALTNHHVVAVPTSAQPTSLTVAPAPLSLTFGGSNTAGSLVVVDLTLVSTAGAPNQDLDVFRATTAADTPTTIAAGIAATINALANPGVSAAAAGPKVTVTAGAGVTINQFVGTVYGPRLGDASADLRAALAGGVITLSGHASNDHGVFINVNTGGAHASFGVFVPVAKGDALSAIAAALAAAINARNVAGVTATANGAQVTINGAMEFECDITSDVRFGQPEKLFCSCCSPCCDKRIGRVLDARIDVDAALIQLDPGLKYLAQIAEIGIVTGTHTITGPEVMAGPYAVRKRGRTTRLTSGTVLALNRDGDIGLADKATPPAWRIFHRHYTDAISILSSNANPFSAPGDSGSALVNAAGEVVGLVFGGGTLTGLATPIDAITTALNIAVVTATKEGVELTVPAVAAHAAPAAADAAAPAIGPTPLLERLQEAEREITSTAVGREYAAVVRRHTNEAVRLVNGNRRVAAAWQRNGGPQIVQAILRMIWSPDERLPAAINGRPLVDCLRRLQDILTRYGSAALAADLRRYGQRLRELSSLTYPQLVAALAASPEQTAMAGTLETVARQVGLALQPLQDRLAPDQIISLFADLGVQFPPQLLTLAFVGALNSGVTAATALPTTVGKLSTAIDQGDDAATLQLGAQLLQQIATTVAALEQVGTQLDAMSGSLAGMNAAEVKDFAKNLASRLLSYLVISALKDVAPGAVGVGNLLGILDYLPNPGVLGDPLHPPYVTRQLQLSRLGDLFTSPANVMGTLYGWGKPGFDGKALVSRLNTSLGLFGVRSALNPAGNSLEASIFTLQATPPRLTATVKYAVPAVGSITLPLTATWSVNLQAQGTFAAGLQATVTPPANLSFKPPNGQLNGQLAMDLTAKGAAAGAPIILLGQTGGSRLQTDAFTFGVGVSAAWDAGSGTATVEPQVRLKVTGGRAVIDMSQADGFLAAVTSGLHVEAAFDLNATWQPDTGLHIEGGAQLTLTLPLHLSLGPISLPLLYLTAGASSSGIPIELSVALGVTLGPIQASVDRVGVKALLSFPDRGGNLGPADLAVAFKPPNGLGIAIDAGLVAGGGYIFFDPDKGEYAGVLDVSLAEVVQVKVIALLDTVLPDGSRGFSFLLIITFDFPPIQLGFGFTLNGVGGLAGVNRTMSFDALRAGFRAHTLDSVLFPPDPIKNAPQIISNVRSFFPPAEGRFVFGPMFEFGWGTPTLITLSIGAILEVPDPVRLALLGLIDAGLPDEDAALIELHIDVLGLIDFGTKKLSIDGSLFDSRVLVYALSGDLALRLTWGDNPNFLFSLGGFNPHFNTAGLDVPALHRLSVSIGDGDNPRISTNSYFAVTSNTVQFGANVEAYASAGGFSIHGYLGFDVLIIVSPFSFEFDFSAGFDVSFDGHHLCGLDVNGVFSGPRPWHLHGDATIHILFFSVSASVTLTWGDPTPVTLPQRAVLPDLLAALQDPRNWNTALPDGTTQAVTLATPTPDGKTLRVHPMGTLSVRENVVPLDLPITRYGNATPADGTFFSIDGVQVNGQPATKQPFQEYFAVGQFVTLSDGDKLSRPSFEAYDAGVTVGAAGVATGADARRNVVYKESYVDDPAGFSRFARRYFMAANVHLALTRQGAASRSLLKTTSLSKYRTGPQPPPIVTRDPSYVVAGVADLAVRSDVAPAGGGTYFQARAALASYLKAHPEEAANLQIVPVHEVAP